MSEPKVDSKVTVYGLPIDVYEGYAKRSKTSAAHEATFIKEADRLSSHYEKSGSNRAIFRSENDKLFGLSEGAPHQALFEEPPVTHRLPLHVFSQGEIFSLSLAENEALEWAHDRPTRESLLKCLGLPEDLDKESSDGKMVRNLEEWLFFQRLAAYIWANTHKRKV